MLTETMASTTTSSNQRSHYQPYHSQAPQQQYVQHQHQQTNSTRPQQQQVKITSSNNSNSVDVKQQVKTTNIPNHIERSSSSSLVNSSPPPVHELHHAVQIGDIQTILRLHSRLRHGEQCLIDDNGHTPLYVAIEHGRGNIVDLLLHLGHNPYCITVNRDSALNTAILYNRYDIVEYLLNRGYPVDHCGFENKIPLELALECNHGHIVILLLKYNCNWRYVELKKSMSLVEWALKHQYPTILGVLIDLYGDDENVFNAIGNTCCT
ncbi:unnamed protein product [Didymodactylos carnosus]|uniref:Uncharacterized protein n=1 Tax=Didymodactylos carnosus TaxID=1234261 RepID=A0A814XG10_9BILA|nr:unnamed protein product [Didymodactylos carnosus]CAF1215874.1 unnamed protein product [Didymodactylos carnosus]CAF3775764.1 unnamed protein product [Didymodactylos carnosus]CAF3979650.1 unnamed protein product [Didymodactylos carnosus]